MSTPVQVADGVWRLPLLPLDLVNAFLLRGDDGSLALVDAGTAGAPRALLAGLAALGHRPEDVTHLVLSHAHNDHAGGAAEVVRTTGSRVSTHEREAADVRAGRMPGTDRTTTAGRLLARLPGRFSGFAPVEVDATFSDGDVVPVGGGLRVVHTPGHTPGHCSFLLPSRGVLLTSDALFNLRRLRWPLAALCTDWRRARASAGVLGELDYDVAGFTHGPHVDRDARTAVRAFLAGRPS